MATILEWLAAIWTWIGSVTLTLREAFLLVVLAVLVTLYVSVRAFVPAEAGSSDAFQPGFTQEDDSKGLPLIPMSEENAAPPAHIEPGKPIRRITVTVQPDTPVVHYQPVKPNPDGTCPVPEAVECPAVTVDLSIIRDDKGIYRTIASSPDGAVISGMDIPLHDFTGPEKRNTAMVYANPQEQAGAATYTRSFTVFGKDIDAGAAVFSVPGDRFIPMAGVGTSW